MIGEKRQTLKVILDDFSPERFSKRRWKPQAPSQGLAVRAVRDGAKTDGQSYRGA